MNGISQQTWEKNVKYLSLCVLRLLFGLFVRFQIAWRCQRKRHSYLITQIWISVWFLFRHFWLSHTLYSWYADSYHCRATNAACCSFRLSCHINISIYERTDRMDSRKTWLWCWTWDSRKIVLSNLSVIAMQWMIEYIYVWCMPACFSYPEYVVSRWTCMCWVFLYLFKWQYCTDHESFSTFWAQRTTINLE